MGRNLVSKKQKRGNLEKRGSAIESEKGDVKSVKPSEMSGKLIANLLHVVHDKKEKDDYLHLDDEN